MKKMVFALLCASLLVLAMSVSAMAAPSPEIPEFPDTEHLYESEETEPESKSTAESEASGIAGSEKPGFPETEYLYENGSKTGRSDTSPKTGEGMEVMYAAFAALAFAGTACLAKKRLVTKE